MAELMPGDQVSGGAWVSGTQWSGLLLRRDPSGMLVFLPGTASFDYGFVKRVTRPLKDGIFDKHGLTASPVYAPQAPIADAEAALREFLDAVSPGSGKALAAATPIDVSMRESYFSGFPMRKTAAGLQIAIDVSDFESRDMVTIEHHWRWAVLFQPLVVAGVYHGDRGSQAQVLCDGPLPPAAAVLFRRLGAS